MASATLLLPYDGSPAARRAAALVAGWKAAEPPTVVAVNVQPRPLQVRQEPWLDPTAVDAALTEAGKKVLAKLRLRAEKEVRLGPPASEIVAAAQARAAEAIVMGTRGEGLLRGYALGSVALRVAQSATAPTLLVKKDSRLPAALGSRLKVLLATDGSAPCVRAAELLARWKPMLGELDAQLAYVQEPLSVLEALLPPHDDVARQWSDEDAKAASSAPQRILREAGAATHLHISAGEPAPEIAQLADQAGCELIAMGTRGRGAAHHALVGSVAMKVAAIARVPVLLVP